MKGVCVSHSWKSLVFSFVFKVNNLLTIVTDQTVSSNLRVYSRPPAKATLNMGKKRADKADEEETRESEADFEPGLLG
jgi:hypothetical protein